MKELEQKKCDVAIIGGGPGGIAAALWCADLGLSSILIEGSDIPGGQLFRIYSPIANYPGLISISGPDLAKTLRSQLLSTGAFFVVGSPVVQADLSTKQLRLANGTAISCDAVIIATGVSRRRLGVDGEQEFYGKGILESGARQRNDVAGLDVVIVGGGDAALENASILGEYAKTVTVVHRGEEFRARDHLIREAQARPNVNFRLGTVVKRFLGDGSLTAIELSSRSGAESRIVSADRALIRIGVEPNTEFFAKQIAADEAGYVRVDAKCATNIDGVFAVGDVASPRSPTIATAVGMGATAAKNALAYLARRRK